MATIRIMERHCGTINLLATDVVMPGLGGRPLAERFLDVHPEARILYLSGYTDDSVVRHGVLQEDVHSFKNPFPRSP
jgi:two-component system, cell cycle sensor histidine kinase and response regulator CckA